MYVEDLLIKIRNAIIGERLPFGGTKYLKMPPFGDVFNDPWHRDFIQSVCKYADEKRSLSTKQAEIVIKIIDRIRPEIMSFGWATQQELSNLIADPTYRVPLYESSNVPREVRYLGDNLLAFRCKANKVLTDRIKTLDNAAKTGWLDGTLDNFNLAKDPRGPAVALKARFDWLHKIWIVPVYRFNLESIAELIADQRFNMDQETANYLRLAHKSLDQSSLFAIDAENKIILANICDDPILSGWITEIANGVRL